LLSYDFRKKGKKSPHTKGRFLKIKIPLLCSYVNSEKISLTHRANSMKAVLLKKSHTGSHRKQISFYYI
jgi:hypothetical protein